MSDRAMKLLEAELAGDDLLTKEWLCCIEEGRRPSQAMEAALRAIEAALSRTDTAAACPTCGATGHCVSVQGNRLPRQHVARTAPASVMRDDPTDEEWAAMKANAPKPNGPLTPIAGADTAADERRAVVEECARVAEQMRVSPSYAAPTDWDYGAQDACVAIAKAIRALAANAIEAGDHRG